MNAIKLSDYKSVVFFTGAGMSAECGIPTYRGHGGIWHEYNYEDYACQRAFNRDPQKVLDFHEMRRAKALSCEPHVGHLHLSRLQAAHPRLHVITQNVDGMHQRAGTRGVVELHGSLWRMRCRNHGITEDAAAGTYERRTCPLCEEMLRPDITWFGDRVDTEVFDIANVLASNCQLFVAIGTSGVVWPAAGLLRLARLSGARTIEINLEETEATMMHNETIPERASVALPQYFCF